MKGWTIGILIALYAPVAVCAAGVSRIIPGTDTTTTPTVDSELRTATDSKTTQSRKTSGRASGLDAAQTRTASTRAIVRVSSAESAVAGDGVARSVSNRASAVTRSLTPSDTARSNLESAVRNSGRNSRTEAAGINANPAVRRMGLTLRPSTAEVGGRAIMADGSQTGSNIESEIRNLQSRVATVKSRDEVDPAAIAEAKDRLEQTAELNKSCQEQYNDCMDQFCSVIDANQKRCSCSANLAKYSKVEQAVKEANAKLNEVAQNIRYVGLSADEISAIMSATEAEEALSGTTDTTESRSMLAEIEKMIKDPTTTSSSSFSTDSYGLLDIDTDFSSSDLDDLFSLDFLNNSSKSFSNLRGSELYNAAKKRCNTVISQCKEVGATAQQITGNYDLAIDKDCIAYEQGLNKMNETLISNVRSATRMLQKARLAVLQNQNTYDARGCVAALETCMTDEMVCGEKYTKCLDPTKMYIDENGNVVLGKDINTIQDFMTDYNNASVNYSFLSEAYTGTTIEDSACKNDGDGRCVVKYLLSKIGTKQKATDEGLCRPVLDKCRAYTYDTRGNYNAYNDIVVNYIQRAMVNIKAAQYQIVSDYASTCLTDIATCYNNQVSQLTSWSSAAAASSVYNIMRGACRNVALTCGYAVFAADSESCSTPANCIENISKIFYQSLLCPDNSEYRNTTHKIDDDNTVGGYVNQKCQCKSDYVVFSGSCLPRCAEGVYSALGVCTTATCPVGSSEVSESEADFWGHCKCNGSSFWVPSKSSCKTCPNNSNYTSDGSGDILDGLCKCTSSYEANSALDGCDIKTYVPQDPQI